MTTLLEFQFILLAVAVIRSLHSALIVDSDERTVHWHKGILKGSLEQSFQILESVQDRSLYLKRQDDLLELPISVHDAFPRLMFTQDCSADNFGTMEQWKTNMTNYLDNIRRGNESAAHNVTIPSIILAICPEYQNLCQFERTIRLIIDLDIQQNFTVSSILLNFGALGSGQINAFHIIEYVQAAKKYELHANFTTGLLLEHRICFLMTAQILSYQLGEISQTEVYLEVMPNQKSSDFSTAFECLNRFGLRPAYLLPTFTLFEVEDYFVLEHLHLLTTLPDSTIPMYNLTKHSEDPDQHWRCSVNRKLLEKPFPVDYFLSIDYSDFLVALERINVTIRYEDYNATFLDAHRKFLVQFEDFFLGIKCTADFSVTVKSLFNRRCLVANVYDLHIKELAIEQLVKEGFSFIMHVIILCGFLLQSLAKTGVPKVLSKILQYVAANPKNYFTHPLSLWIAFKPSPEGDLRTELLDLLDSVLAARKQVKGLLSHILIDYGPLRVTPDSVPLIRRDIDTCNNILKPNNLSCGFIFHKRNCLQRTAALEELHFDKHNIIIIGGFNHNCRAQLFGRGKLGFKSGSLTIDFTANKITTTTKVAMSAVDVITGCTTIDEDIFMYSAVVLDDNPKVRDSTPSYDPESNWLEIPFSFTGATGFTYIAFEVKLFTDLPRNIVLLDELALVDGRDEQVSTLLNIANRIRQTNSSECNYGVSVTFAVGSILEAECNRLDVLFENIESAMIISQAPCFTVLLDWSPSYLSVDSNNEEADLKLVERKELFLRITEYAQNKFSESGIPLDIYIDDLFIRARNIMLSGNLFENFNKTKLWQSAFRNVNYFVYRVETSMQILLKQSAYKTAKGVVVEMESAFQSTQAMLYEFVHARPDSGEYLDRIAFQITLLGCSSSLNLRQLTEIAKFWEIINNWAYFMNEMVVIVDSAILDTTKKCDLKKPMRCPCGWWVNNGGSLTDLKTLAYNLSQTPKSNILPVAILTPTTVLITCSLMFVLATVFVVGLYYWRRQANMMVLTRNQVTELLKGHDIGATRKTYKQFVYDKSKLVLKHRDIRYDSSWEVNPPYFLFSYPDKNNVIGSGESGTIIASGTLRCFPNVDKVAVKVFKFETGKQFNNQDYSAIKSLVTEANILNFLGEHENLIKLYGACTTNLRKGEMVLALEYCPNGSLDKLLRHMRRVNEDQSSDSTVNPECRYEDLPILISRWSFEIANGMEYLASKSVVHGDLAARNILLDANQTVKISDFGLSRVRSNDGPYIKEGLEPLPWRWMPPESLKMSIFNEKTDVWSFGITLWEMHTFGEIPYGGISCNPLFIQMVDKGMRPDMPHTVPVYALNVITACWKLKPTERPTFRQCTNALSQ